jgi:dTDP-4-dehydrorhamnose 3,5-epimerase
MKIERTKFKDLLIFKKSNFKDSRGYFLENFKKKLLKYNFPFTCLSFSKKNVLRGLHLQVNKMQGKYISVLKGRIIDVAVDLRKNSRTFGKHYKIELSEKNCKSIFIPPGFAHGFYTLDKENYVLYSCTNYRNKNSEVGILWNDLDLKIKWPTVKPIVSDKDKKNISFDEFNKKYKIK